MADHDLQVGLNQLLQSHLLPSYPWELEALSWLVVAQASDSIRDFRKLLCLVPRTRQYVVLNDGDSYLNISEEASLRQSRHIQ